jgi:hypothetical protein
MACPSCGANVGHLLGCERGTVSLAREAPAAAASDELIGTSMRARALAVPVALAAMALFAFTSLGQSVLRLFFGMWLHEFGHAAAAWVCGITAVPLPWVTLQGNGRSGFFIALEVLGLGALAWRLWRDEEARARVAVPAAGLVALLVGVLAPLHGATAFIVFSGDGGALILGAALMALSTLPDASRLSRGGLRWGYLVIGAGAFADVFHQWFAAWRDVAALPFGRIEGVGLSDATRLVEQHGWSEAGLLRAYLGLGLVCLALVAARVVQVARDEAG